MSLRKCLFVLLIALVLLVSCSDGDDDDDDDAGADDDNNDDTINDDDTVDDDTSDDDTGDDDDDDDTGDDDTADDDTQPDTTPPTFDGATDALQEDNSVCLIWSPATDDTDESADIVYRVYMSSTSGGQDLENPTLTTEAGVCEACVNDLYYAGIRFFVVRAVDTAGNEDENTVEVTGSPRPARYTKEGTIGDGLEPDDPAGTIQENIDDIGANANGIVYVAAGTYGEHVEILAGVAMIGGYNADFSQCDPAAYATIINGTKTDDTPIVRAANGTRIDGFTIRGAVGNAAGINAVNASTEIANNLISGNNRHGIYFGAVPEEVGGSGMASNPIIENNVIIDNGHYPCLYDRKERNGVNYVRYYFDPCAGIYGYNLRGATQATIRNNIIADNIGHGLSFDVGYTQTARFDLSNNDIADNTWDGIESEARGFYFYDDDPGLVRGEIANNIIRNNRDGIRQTGDQRSIYETTITNNQILANARHGVYGSILGFIGEINVFGFWVHYNLPSEYNNVIRNNIIAQNAGDGISLEAAGFDWYPYSTHPLNSSATISAEIINNNIVNNAQNGVSRALDTGGNGMPAAKNNIVFNNADDLADVTTTYTDVGDGDSGTGNLNVDPQFVFGPDWVDFTVDGGDADLIVVNDNSTYMVGDYLEINADGKARQITSLSNGTDVIFTPALEDASVAGMAVAYWGENTDVDEDYQLQAGSDCIDAGDPDAVYNDAQPPGQGTERNDMGAYGGPQAGTVGPEED